MEEILTKNVFKESDLIKHNPDYSPQDIFLRLQLRRAMARDTHKHGVLRYSSKNNIKKTKGHYKLKKEIVKLRSYFENINLQNKSSLKEIERITKVQSLPKKKHCYITSNNDENDFIGNEMALYNINKTFDDKIDLAIESDNVFELLVEGKPKLQDETNFKRNLKSIKYNSDVLDIKENKKELNGNNSFKCETDKCVDVKQKTKISINSMPQLNEVKNDLQSLLIMMAINSKMDENVEHGDTYQETIFFKEDTKKIAFEEIDSMHSKFKLSNEPPNDLIPFLNITYLGKDLTKRERFIANKYINKWKLYVITKKENFVSKQRQETLNNFFDKLSKKKNKVTNGVESIQKAKLAARDYDTYQHRYKVQKHIIALQKSKLEEQNKLIEQLKYNKIVEASRNSLDTMREDVRKTYYEIDKHLKPKIKCLTNELKISDFEEPSLVLHCLKVPQFLKRMEARARAREEKHALIRERRKQIEEERIKQKQQAELAKLEIDKEEKMRRIKELKEKRRKEKIENIRKKQHVERLRALIVMADLHYEKQLMKKYGIRPLRRLMEMKHEKIEKANAHYRIQLLNNVFLNWMWHTEDMCLERNYKAEDFYRKKILKKVFVGFRKNHHEFVLKKQVAEDYYDLYVTQIVFKNFCKGIAIIKKEFEVKWQKAVVYYNSNILFKTFTCWRTLPALNALKREQDARKLRWREKVLLVVPDYKPPED
ncbi:unnamed protein product [Euphydryas editha]|uniref:Uncharacterized protein n=1 Tax=Euphydryas editha TaxID=104508 RepID=A0AAU9VDI6_EUPED|nr:unnamed protein product [Euphydryas editha]